MSLAKFLRKLGIPPDPEFIADADDYLPVADEVYEIGSGSGCGMSMTATLFGLHGDGTTIRALFSHWHPSYEGCGPCDKTGRAVFKGVRPCSFFRGTYRVEVKQLLESDKLCIVKMYDESKRPDDKPVWSGLGHGVELTGEWEMAF